MLKLLTVKKKNQKGFSLVELIVVVAILGILAAVAVPSVAGYIEDAKKSTDESNAQEIEAAILRRVALGKIALPASSAGDMIDEIESEVTIPDTPQQGAEYGFYVDLDTGKVQCIKKANASEDLDELTE